LRIVVTGAGGFVGRALMSALEGKHDLVALDNMLSGYPGVEGDLCDPTTLNRAFSGGCDAVVHLATVPGGAAETDPSLAYRVNVEGTMALIDAAAKAGNRPRFIFASSIAVFGDPLPASVNDKTPVAPRMVYGAHKAMMELWLETQTRQGAISGLALRLPGIVARPGSSSGLKSAFMSNLFVALKAGEPIELPVSPDATLWLMSRQLTVHNLIHALGIDENRSLTLPALRTTMGTLVAAVARKTDADPALVSYTPDIAIESGFGRQPPLATDLADILGFRADPDVDALVAAALSDMK
jgi:nucleoside-diphosphate-sugar epimerase